MCGCSTLVQILLGGFWPLTAPSQFQTKTATELSSIGGFSLSPTSLMIGIYPPVHNGEKPLGFCSPAIQCVHANLGLVMGAGGAIDVILEV